MPGLPAGRVEQLHEVALAPLGRAYRCDPAGELRLAAQTAQHLLDLAEKTDSPLVDVVAGMGERLLDRALVDRQDLLGMAARPLVGQLQPQRVRAPPGPGLGPGRLDLALPQEHPDQLRVVRNAPLRETGRSEEHTSELQSRVDIVGRLLLEKKKDKNLGPALADETSELRRETQATMDE